MSPSSPVFRVPQTFVSAVLTAGLSLTACGSDEVIDASKGTVSDAATTTTAPSAVVETTAAETTTTAAETTTTTVAETTTKTAAPIAAGPADGVPFTDPDGNYSILVGPDWTNASGDFPPGVAGWFTGQDTDQFAENVNIVTDSIASSTAMGDLLDVSQAQIAAQFPSFNLISSEVVTRAGQPDLGLLEYTAEQQNIEIRFVQVFGIWDGALVVVTGSTDARLGSEGVERLRPYVLTLAPPV